MDLIEDIKNQIIEIKDPEIGDFKRRAGLYLNRLISQIGKDQKKLAKVMELRENALYEHFEDVEDLRQLLLEKLDQIRN